MALLRNGWLCSGKFGRFGTFSAVLGAFAPEFFTVFKPPKLGGNGPVRPFSCKIDTSGIEEILLRNILNCFDEKYIITDAYDAYDRDENKEIIKGSEDIVFVTNMPFDLFMKI